MPDPMNPFAPPKASLDPISLEGYWRDGKVLVLRPGCSLPPRCVKCNAPAEMPMKSRKVYWHPPWLYSLVVLAIPIYLIVALITRKQAKVAPGLCALHRKRYWQGIGVGWGGLLLGILLIVASAALDDCFLAVLGALLCFGAIVAGIILSRILLPVGIDKDFVRLKGCGQAFLDSLPEFHG
jgi:hypothetical protein